MNRTILRQVFPLLRPYRHFAVISLFFALLSTAAQLMIPIFCGRAIDGMVSAGAVQFSPVLHAMAVIGAAALVGALSQRLLALCNNRMAFSVCCDLRKRLGEKLHRLPVSYLDAHPTGDTVSRMIADVDTFADGLLMGFTQLFTGVLTILATLIIMLALNGAIALAVLLLTPFSIFTARFISKRINRFFQAQAAIRGEQTAFVNEWIEGQRTVRAFGREELGAARFGEINQRLQKASLQATFFSSLTNPSTRTVNNLVYATVALISSLYAVSGGLSIGQLSVFLSYASQYAKPFNEISGVITELQNALTCARRVFALLEEPEEAPDPLHPEQPPVKGEVRLDRVSFQYTPDRPLITDFSLHVSPGQQIAIVGPTGCGKTTLINLLMRFYDCTGGQIFVDGAPIPAMTRHQLRSRYGMVLQDTWLSSGTVRENIAYGRPDATKEEIEAAAKAAFSHSFICRLPQGYDTPLKENGSNLSAGQRQLLCIARAMLTVPSILILDEATSSIDTRTEQKIQAAFTRMMEGRTSFVVAHRLSTIRRADVILVMKDGRVIEQGDHDSLLAKGGFYATLYRSQFQQAPSAP